MKPVTQTRTGSEGNCWAAALASVLECPIEEVDVVDGEDPRWWEKIQRHLAAEFGEERSLDGRHHPRPGFVEDGVAEEDPLGALPVIEPEGTLVAVLGRDGTGVEQALDPLFGERHPGVHAAVDARVVADHVEVGVRVAVAGDEPVAGGPHVEGVRDSVGDVLHVSG